QLKRKRGGAIFSTTNAAIRSAFKSAHASILATLAWHPHNAAATWDELDSAGKTKAYESELEFEKAYAAHATPDVIIATSPRFTEAGPDITANVVGERLRLSGTASVKRAVVAMMTSGVACAA